MERVADKTFAETQTRFWSFVEKTETCWIWRSVLRAGYGRFKIRGRYYSAHRLAYEWLVEAIPDGMTLDHGEHCGNRACVNPAHLEVVTLSENTARSNRRRTGPRLHLRGWRCEHPRTEENIYRPPRGGELCRVCRSERQRRYRGKEVVSRRNQVQTSR